NLCKQLLRVIFFYSSRRRHTRSKRDWSSDVCSSDLKKNLDYALETLMNCRSNIEFDIYGTLEEIGYWEKCKEIIETLPINIHVSYKGELNNRKVINTLSNYDLFYFPTKSEKYGHVISEALQASIPILISDQTPWKNLAEKKYGWEF